MRVCVSLPCVIFDPHIKPAICFVALERALMRLGMLRSRCDPDPQDQAGARAAAALCAERPSTCTTPWRSPNCLFSPLFSLQCL